MKKYQKSVDNKVTKCYIKWAFTKKGMQKI